MSRIVTADGRPVPPIPQVVFAHCHNGDVRGDWAACYKQLCIVDVLGRQLAHPFSELIEKGLYIHRNRNQVCKKFLAERKEPWLMFLDTDMLFAPVQFYALYDEAMTLKPGVHAGLYYGIYASEGVGEGIRPSHGGIMLSSTWLKRFPDHVATIADRKLEVRDDLDGCGMGFTLIHRSVLEALAEAMPHHNNAWFGHDEFTDPKTGEIDGSGEDMTFCDRAKKLGFTIYGHGSISLGHDKRYVITWETHDSEQRRLFGDRRAA